MGILPPQGNVRLMLGCWGFGCLESFGLSLTSSSLTSCCQRLSRTSVVWLHIVWGDIGILLGVRHDDEDTDFGGSTLRWRCSPRVMSNKLYQGMYGVNV